MLARGLAPREISSLFLVAVTSLTMYLASSEESLTSAAASDACFSSAEEHTGVIRSRGFELFLSRMMESSSSSVG